MKYSTFNKQKALNYQTITDSTRLGERFKNVYIHVSSSTAAANSGIHIQCKRKMDFIRNMHENYYFIFWGMEKIMEAMMHLSDNSFEKLENF